MGPAMVSDTIRATCIRDYNPSHSLRTFHTMVCADVSQIPKILALPHIRLDACVSDRLLRYCTLRSSR